MKQASSFSRLIHLFLIVFVLCGLSPRGADAKKPSTVRSKNQPLTPEGIEKRADEALVLLRNPTSVVADRVISWLTPAVKSLRSTGLANGDLGNMVYSRLGLAYLARNNRKRNDIKTAEALFLLVLKNDPTYRLPSVEIPKQKEAWEVAVNKLPPESRAQALKNLPEDSTLVPKLPTEEPKSVKKLDDQDLIDLLDRPAQRKKSGQSTSLQDNSAVVWDHIPPSVGFVNKALHLKGSTSVPVAKAKLWYKLPSQGDYQSISMHSVDNQAWSIEIPASILTEKEIAYYLEAVGVLGENAGLYESPKKPVVVKLIEAPVFARTERSADFTKSPRLASSNAGAFPLGRAYLDFGIGSGGAVVGQGTPTEIAWFHNRSSGEYERARTAAAGGLWSGVAVKAEVGAFLWKGLSISLSGQFEPYLNNNAESASLTNGNCSNGLGQMIPCYAVSNRNKFGFLVTGKVRYQFLIKRASWFRPYVDVSVGGGGWRGALPIDNVKPKVNGMPDDNSPYQPTDLCSAVYNGKTDGTREPAVCNSVGNRPGYNRLDKTGGQNLIPTQLNRVCPNGSCTDSILMGNLALGAGFGFYLGGKHVGLNVEFHATGLFQGKESGALFSAYIGPQIVF